MKRKIFAFSLIFLCLVQFAFAQNRTITGKVSDSNGQPLIGTGIVIKGTTTGTVSDLDGNFTLDVPAGAILEVSSIGYKTKEVEVGEKSHFEIVLEEDSELLEGSVVIGYGTVKRTNFTGSVATYDVGNSAVSNVPKTNAIEMLRGLAPGVQMSQSGLANSEPSILVRGQKSISGSGDPLIVLDGVIYRGSITDIDPNTIEDISVMKDATSLAAYGSQAANGVISITSKKGKAGKPTVNFKGSVSLVEQNYKPDLRDGYEYIDLINARRGEPEGSTSWMSDVQLAQYNAGEQTDWIDYVSRTGVQQEYSMNVSGGGENMNYLFGASYSDNTNFIKGNEFIRETVTGRFNTDINKYISAGLNFNWADFRDDGVRPGYTRFFSPWGDPDWDDGSRRKYIAGASQETAVNPLWNVYNGIDSEYRGHSSTVGGYIDVKIPHVEGLSYKITGNYTRRVTYNRYFVHEENLIQPTDTEMTTETYDKYLSQAYGYRRNNRYTSWVLDNIITYNREIGRHYINATLVYTRDYAKTDIERFDGQDFSGIGNTSLGFWGLDNADTQTITNLTYTLHTDVGYLARINYSYKDKYHFNASIRRDGSSVFGEDHKWGNFPAVGVAWTISDEPFFKVPGIDYLKLKASWGKNGNQSLDPYGSLSRMTMGRSGGTTVYFDGNPVYGETMTQLGNPDLGWETTESWNFGFEGDFLDRRFHWETDAYVSKTTDQIFSRTIPIMGAGIETQSSTMGQINNWGIESSLRAAILRNVNGWNWTATLNFTINRNKLKELYGDGQDDITNNLFIGKSLGAIYGYVWDGVVQEDDTEYMAANGVTAGDIKNKDLDGDGVITPNDRKVLGYDKEAFRMSLNTTLSWKNWSLYLMFTGTFSGGMYGKALNNNAYMSYTEGMMYLNTVDHPYWTAENKSNKYPKPWNVSGELYALQNYGFIRLQDLNLSYTIPEKIVKKVGVSAASVYFSGTNLFFIAPDWEYSDPEVRTFLSPQLRRTYSFGINVRF